MRKILAFVPSEIFVSDCRNWLSKVVYTQSENRMIVPHENVRPIFLYCMSHGHFEYKSAMVILIFLNRIISH